jgi:ketosteroid isomerase-like protein
MAKDTHISSEDSLFADFLIEKERRALERWNNGDPSGYLEISSTDVVYFDPFIDQRLNGLGKLTQLYESIQGQIHVDRYEMLHPKVQTGNDMAVLTFNLNSYEGNNCSFWNCTEVYKKEPSGEWKIVQTHWSFTQPKLL